jgi:hypothetical protein
MQRRVRRRTHGISERSVTPQLPGAEPVVADVPALTALPGHATAAALRRMSLLQRQRSLGNAGLQRAGTVPAGVCPACGRIGHGRCPDCGQSFVPVQRRTLQRDAAASDPATRAAQAVYDALDGWNNEPRALRALRVADAGVRRRIPGRFQALDDSDGASLTSFLKDQLGGDNLVRAFALLDDGHTHGAHTSLALALIPLGTRDTELLRVLEGAPLAGRREIERRYNRAFASIGEGSLRADLKDDLSGADLQKALVLLDRDLSDADKLYFDSVAITGTHDDAVVNRIQSTWQRGPAAFEALERQWNQQVRNQTNGGDEVWTAMTLREAMRDELSGETWELVKAVLDGYEAYQQGQLSGEVFGGVGPPSADQQNRLEDIQLQVANDTLTAATTGGVTGAGTNEEQVFQALTTIRTIWLDRIRRAEQAEDAARAADLRGQWEAERRRLATIVNSEMDEGGSENLRARLLLLGSLTPADEVYLAQEAYDNDRVVSLVTSYWAKGQIAELRRLAGEERRDDRGQVVRPRFELNFTIPVTAGVTWSRMHHMVRGDSSDVERGVHRLKLEIDEGDNDSDLRRAYDLLNTAGISSTLRTGVIERYVAQYCADAEGETATRKFLNHINRRYQRSRTCYDFLDLLEPSTDPRELLTRAEGRMAASQTGVFDAVLAGFVRDYDLATGEDTQAVAQESLARLRHIVAQSGASPAELEGMMRMTGATSVAQLAQGEYRSFQARLEELRQLKRAITDAIVTVIELTIETVLTIATGGAAAGALIASLSAAVAGMLARELLLGQDYDLVSRQNAQQLALIIASHGFGSFGRGLVSDAVNPEQLERLSRARAFMQGMLSDAMTQVSVQTLAMGFEGRMPSAEDIGARALTMLGSAVGSGASGTITRNLSEHLPTITRMRTQIAANVSQNMISGLAEESGGLVRSGVGNLTGAEIALRFGRRGANSISTGIVAGVRDVTAEDVGAERRRRAEERARQGEGDDLEDRAHRHGSGDRESAHDPAAAASDEPGTLSVSPVNPEHNVSVVRTADRRVVITICSPACSRLHVLLEQAQAHLDSESALQFYAAQARDIERRLNDDPNDRDALVDLDELADGLGSLISRIGESPLFGAGGSVPGAVSEASLIRDGEFVDSALRDHYADYRAQQEQAGREAASREEWVRLTRGAARERLDQLLGSGWSARSSGQGGSEPITLSDIQRPPGYSDDQVAAHLAQLQNDPRLFERLGNLEGGDAVDLGHLNILKGNIGEILSQPIQQAELTRLREQHPDARIETGITMRLMGPDGLEPPRLFSDNIIVVERDGNLHILGLFEVKAGGRGGQEATGQLFEWIEGRLTTGDGSELVLADGRSFRYDPGNPGAGRVIGLASGRRHIIAAQGAEQLGSGSADQIAGAPERHALGVTAGQLEFLARRVLETRE